MADEQIPYGPALVPSEDRHMSAREILEELPRLLPSLLGPIYGDARAAETAWDVLSARKGLLGPTYTLQKIGDGLQLTRQRVQQIEKEADKQLRTFWAQEFTSDRVRLQPNVSASIRWLYEGAWSTGDLIMRDRDLLDRLQLVTPTDEVARNRLVFLYEFRGIELHRAERKQPLWVGPSAGAHRLASAVWRIDAFMAEHGDDGMTTLELAMALNQRSPDEPVDPALVRAAIPFLENVEVLADGRVRARLERLVRPEDQAYRMLVEAGDILRLDDMLRRIHATRDRKHRIVRGYLSNLMSADDRFLPIARTGYWGIVGRDEARAVNFWERVVEALRRLAAPSTAQAIAEAMTPPETDRKWVITYLHQLRGTYVEQLKDRRWVLSEWREARDADQVRQPRRRAKVITRAQAAADADLVRILSDAGDDGLPIGAVTTALARSQGRAWASAYGYVKRSEVVELSGFGRTRRVQLRRDVHRDRT